MKRFYALLAKDLRLFFRRSGVVTLALAMVLLGALALGGGDLSRGAYVEPFPIAVRDEDQTLMSASLIGQMKQVELFSEVYDGGSATDASWMARGAAAVVTIPKDFFYDLYTMEPVTVDLALNEDMPLEASLIRAVFTSVMDIIAANESVHLAVYDFCYGPLDQQEQAQLWEAFSNRLLRDALGRQLVFDTEQMAVDTADTVQSALRLCALSMLCLFFPMVSVQAVPAERDTGVLARYRAAGGSMLPFLLAKLVTGLLLTLPTLAVVLALFCREILLRAVWTVLFVYVGAWGVLLVLAVTAKDGAAAQRRGNVFLLLNLLAGGAVYPLPLLPDWLHGVARLTLPYGLTVGLELGLSPALLWPLALGVGGLLWSWQRLEHNLAVDRRRRSGLELPLPPGRWAGATALKSRAMSGGWLGVTVLCAVALLCGAVSRQATSNSTPGALTVAVVQEDHSPQADDLLERLEQVEGLALYPVERDKTASVLRWGDAEGVLTIGEGYGTALADGEQLPLLYESAAAAASNQAAREIVAGQVTAQRARLRGLDDAERLLERPLTAEEKTELLANMDQRYDALPPLYTVTAGAGAAAPWSATAPPLGGTLLLVLFTLLTWGAWMARPDAVRVDQRMTSVHGGRTLSYGTDLLSLWFTGAVVGGLSLWSLKAPPADWLSVGVYVLAVGVVVRAVTRWTGVGGRMDLLAPFLALITSLLGGCFCPLDQFSHWLERLSWLTPQGLALQSHWPVLLAVTVVFLWLGRPKTH
ncbi:ABC transporter permease [Candidatus Avoscillospira sp. LCP25S3_F1]|uniref:ABC transporter permease n=1 Tax=Candidatus Avoscillospira sp. LCP25S3_F1 TaxID=3438825 RepID=UPI003F91045C